MSHDLQRPACLRVGNHPALELSGYLLSPYDNRLVVHLGRLSLVNNPLYLKDSTSPAYW